MLKVDLYFFRGTEPQVQKNKRKARRLLEELEFIKVQYFTHTLNQKILALKIFVGTLVHQLENTTLTLHLHTRTDTSFSIMVAFYSYGTLSPTVKVSAIL